MKVEVFQISGRQQATEEKLLKESTKSVPNDKSIHRTTLVHPIPGPRYALDHLVFNASSLEWGRNDAGPVNVPLDKNDNASKASRRPFSFSILLVSLITVRKQGINAS